MSTIDYGHGLDDRVRSLVQLLLPHAYLLPADRMADAAFLAASGANPGTADVTRLCEIGELLASRVEPEASKAITAASRDLLQANHEATRPQASADRQDRQAAQRPGRTARPRPASLTEASILSTITEFKPLLNENAQEKLHELEDRLSTLPTPDDWDSLALLCGQMARAIAGDLTTPDRQLRLWQIAWWALQRERRNDDAARIRNRLNQLGSVLESFSPQMREALIGAYFADFSVLITSYAKQQFLEWLVRALDNTSDAELSQLRSLATAKLEEFQAPARSRATGHEQLPDQSAITGTNPESLVEMLRDVWGKSFTHEEAISTVEHGWIFLDAKKEGENRRKLDRARSSSGGAIAAQLALAGLRSALWRCRNRETSQADAFTPDHLSIVAGLGGVVYQYSHRDRADVISDLTAIFGMTILLWELVSPSGYARFIDLFGEAAHDDKLHRAIQRSGAAELLNYVNRSAGQRVLMRNPEPWVEALGEWASRYDGADLERLLDLLRESGVQESLALHALRASAAPPSDGEANSIFGPADAAGFENYYQQGQLAPIADLLQKNHRRLLAVVEADLSSETHVEFLPPGGRVDIRVANKNIFSELARKANGGDPAQARDAHNAFDRALRKEKRDEARKTLTEWKAYALFRGSSILEAEPVWTEAAENGYASKEVLWNLAVRKKQQGSPWRGMQYLLPGVTNKSLPLAYVQFGCALAVATLRQTEAVNEGELLYSENRMSRRFLLDYGRSLPVASMHLLWFWLAYSDPHEAVDDAAGTALVTYTGLRIQPHDLPTPAEISRLPRDERLQAIDRVSSGLEHLRDPHFRLTWRLWIGEYAVQNPWWWPAWDRWASACDTDGDPGAAVEILRRAAQSAVWALQRKNLSEKDRESRTRFLRSAVVRLLRFARDLDRSSLLDEIRDRYVQPVPEVSDPKRSENTQLLRRLGLLQSPGQGEEPPPPINLDVWRSLHEDLGQVNAIGDLDEALAKRVEAAARLDPGMTGRNGQMVEAMLSILADIVNLRNGMPADQASALLLRLSDRNKQTLEQVRTARVHQLVAPLKVFERVLKDTAASLDAAPRPAIVLATGWAGWPGDYGSSSLPLELSFPGPGSAMSLRITGGWDSEDYRPQAEIRGVRDIEAGETAAYALALEGPAAGAAQVRIDVSYTWGPLTALSTSAVLEVPRCTFSDFLDERGIAAHEFPNPFIVDKPLDRDQVQGDLFQGRDQQVAEVRASYGPAGFPPLPLCFYGIRKTGKTSLLRRVVLEVEKAGLVGVEVNLFGLRADTHTADQLCLGLLGKIKKSAVSMGVAVEALPLPEIHPNPVLLIEDFFSRLADCFGGSRVLVLLDEYQFLLWGPNGEPVLDSLRPIHEQGRVGFIAFSNQGLDPTNKTNSQLGLRSIRVNFLRPAEVARLVVKPLSEMGVHVHSSAQQQIFEQAAGHPNFSAWLARSALERLNLDHRNVITINDVEASAAEILLSSGAFDLSWFSKQNISATEAEISIRLAKEDNSYTGLELGQANTRLGLTTDVARDLEAKRVVEFRAEPEPNLRIRGRLLWEYLRRQVSVGRVPPPPSGSVDSVGLFVDLENLRPHKPPSMSYGELGRKLISYAAALGDLQARWMAIASWNTGEDWGRVKAELIDAGFLIAQEPSTFSARRREEKRDVADFVLAGQVLDEVAELGLTRVVLVTGDGDMLILVNQLLEKNVPVRLISGDNKSRAADYLALADQRRAAAVANGLQAHETDFDVLLVRDVLSPTNES